MKIMYQPVVLKSLMKSKHFPMEDDSVTRYWQLFVLRSLVFVGLFPFLRRHWQNLLFVHNPGFIYRELDLSHQLEKYSRRILQLLNFPFLMDVKLWLFLFKIQTVPV
jgi:hypothetical protein